MLEGESMGDLPLCSCGGATEVKRWGKVPAWGSWEKNRGGDWGKGGKRCKSKGDRASWMDMARTVQNEGEKRWKLSERETQGRRMSLGEEKRGS